MDRLHRNRLPTPSRLRIDSHNFTGAARHRISTMNRIVLSAAAFFLLATAAFAQGVLVVINPPHPIPLPRPIPHPPSPPTMSYKIKELDYAAKITDQVAQVAVTQSFVNTGSRQMEVSFMFP